MGDLISTSYAKEFMRISSSVNDDLIDQIISGVSGQIERECGRTFNERTYREWVDGEGDSTLRLRNYPVTRLFRVATRRNQVGSITYSGSDTVSTVSLSTSGIMTLANITTSGAEIFKDITLAGKSLSALSTSVGAQTGWSLAIQGTSAGEPVADLRPFTDWGGANNTLDLELPDESINARIMQGTEDTIESVDGSGGFAFGSGLPFGRSNIFAWYKAGYAIIPRGLQQITAEIVKSVFDATSQDASLESEKIGDYSYKLNTALIGNSVAAFTEELGVWCRKEI